MPRGPKKDAVSIEGWLMREKKDIPTTGESLFHCVYRSSVKCPASYAVHKTTNNVRIIQPHINHEIDNRAVQASIEKLSEHISSNFKTCFARQELKRRANDGPAREVINRIRTEFGAEVSVAMGDYHAKRRLIYTAKTRVDPDTKKMNEEGGEISEKYRNTSDGRRFLISDHKYQGDRFVYFASDESLSLLASSNIVFVDGTFACVPKGGEYDNFWQILKVLPFIDAANIPEYWTVIVNSLPPLVHPSLNRKTTPPNQKRNTFSEFIDYFGHNYIHGGANGAPRYSPSMWSCVDVTLNNIHRTTNVVESWHGLLQTVVHCHDGRSELKLSDLLNKLLQEESQTIRDSEELKINPNFQANKEKLFHVKYILPGH
ncbi:unnamed protein product [Caenorhabditis brenneri]